MSTPGSSSGIFNISPQEDDDDLRVPSTCDPADHDDVLSMDDNNNTVVETAQQKSLHLQQQQQHHKTSTTPSLPTLVTSRRTVSDFHLYVDEEALAKMTTSTAIFATPAAATAVAALPSPALSTASSSFPSIFNPTFTASFMATPNLNSNNNFDSLECDWMNRSFQPDEFAKILRDDVLTLQQTIVPGPVSSPNDVEDVDDDYDEEEASVILEVSQVPLESLLQLADLPLPAPLPEETRKKRGRPSKDAESAFTAPAAKKAKKATPSRASVEPSTPKPHPLSRPTSDDPMELERYIKYRQSNNEAACKSRLRRKERERENADKATFLETENAQLKQELSSLQSEVAKLKALLGAHFKKTQ